MSENEKETDIIPSGSSGLTEKAVAGVSSDVGSGRLSPALKKELGHIAVYIAIGLAVMFGIFILCMSIFPEIKESEDFMYYKIFLGGAAGGAVAFLNFFLMGLTVQKVAADTNPERARNRMKLSYTYRYLMQIAWIVIAILVPCFNYISGIVPLLFPSLGIKLASIIFKKY